MQYNMKLNRGICDQRIFDQCAESVLSPDCKCCQMFACVPLDLLSQGFPPWGLGRSPKTYFYVYISIYFMPLLWKYPCPCLGVDCCFFNPLNHQSAPNFCFFIMKYWIWASKNESNETVWKDNISLWLNCSQLSCCGTCDKGSCWESMSHWEAAWVLNVAFNPFNPIWGFQVLDLCGCLWLSLPSCLL